MKIIHLSDLHLGKKLENYDLLEDQKYILTEVLKIINNEKPDAVIIAGDIYDKSVPPVEAVSLFDWFLVKLSSLNLQVYIISGNHDSPERLAFGESLMRNEGIHISPVYNGTVSAITQTDEYGKVNFFLLPFIKPYRVKRYYPESEIASYTDALRTVIDDMHINENERNVLIAHQYVTGAERSDSEEITVGGLDNVDVSVFDGFDYVALGHIHSPQHIGKDAVRYSGTPIKYSFSEVDQTKTVTVIDMKEKGNTEIHCVPLNPLRDMHVIKGTFSDLTSKEYYLGTGFQDDYMRVILTDEDDIPDAAAKLRMVYNYLVRIEYDNTRTRHNAEIGRAEEVDNKSPLELFSELYVAQNGMALTVDQEEYLNSVIEEIWEENT